MRHVDNPYLRGPRRFWYLIVIGAFVAVAAAVSVVDTVKLSLPPKLAPVHKPVYQAQAEALVDTQPSMFFTILRTTDEPQGYHDEKYVTTDSHGVTHVHYIKVNDGVKIKTAPPDHSQATSYANTYPTLIGSTPVVGLRNQMFPNLAKGGVVTAFTLGSSQNQNGRLRPSPLPIIVIQAQAHTPKKATDLATKATIAFQRYVTLRGDRAGGPKTARIVLRILSLPSNARKTTKSEAPVAAVVGILVLGGFVLLTMILERLFPQGRGEEEGSVEGDPLLEAELRRLRRPPEPRTS
jgi:hypothetical protein